MSPDDHSALGTSGLEDLGLDAPGPEREEHVALHLSTGHGMRRVKDVVATVLIILAFVVALVPLFFVVFYVISKGREVFGWDFLTGDIPFITRQPGGGMYPAIVGTIIITLGATAMAVPLGVLGGIYLNEYGSSNPLARLIRFLAEVMTGVPSIVMGLFIYTFWVLPRKENGLSGFSGSLALACLMLPVVIRTTEEILKLVPGELREGSYALGSRKARTIRTVVLPHAAPGITSGALLAVARAAGETAPLLFTIGIITSPANWNLFEGPNTALPQQIYVNASQAGVFPAAQARAWGAALALILIVFLFTIIARIVTALYARRAGAT
jgi:phosphate transport system permease protein